jgi:hypothetical protein
MTREVQAMIQKRTATILMAVICILVILALTLWLAQRQKRSREMPRAPVATAGLDSPLLRHV